jgi:hypothetical protein
VALLPIRFRRWNWIMPAVGCLSWWAILGLNQWPLPCQRRFALAIATAGCRIGILTSEDVLDGSLVSRLDLQRLLTSC